LHGCNLITTLCPVILIIVDYSNFTGTFTTYSSATLFYNGTEAQFKQIFADFLAIPAVATNLGPLSYNQVTKVLTSSESPGAGLPATKVVWIFLLLYVHCDTLIDTLYYHSRMWYVKPVFFLALLRPAVAHIISLTTIQVRWLRTLPGSRFI
jgi:hypothetical protein